MNGFQEPAIQAGGGNQVYGDSQGIFQVNKQASQRQTTDGTLVNAQVDIAAVGYIPSGVGAKQEDTLSTILFC